MGTTTSTCIILVESDKAFAQVLKTRLEAQGKQVRIVPSISRMKSLLQKKTPEVIVMESTIGAMKAIAELRTKNKYKTTPILVSATHASREEVEQAEEAGANAFLLTTQHSPQQLTDSILNWCS